MLSVGVFTKVRTDTEETDYRLQLGRGPCSFFSGPFPSVVSFTWERMKEVSCVSSPLVGVENITGPFV